ncbi:MAG: alkaline phosphatase family protein [Verrucomicrobia bacterium]|nr:alkaline phosphatase family protein [Verrucomicrobiota bacterium]MBI3870236.1 alkaline phosphatase family protein [Verrucomicrobiota bacterium]
MIASPFPQRRSVAQGPDRRARLTLLVVLVGCFVPMVARGAEAARGNNPADPSGAPKLYWFVPDGMRADPQTFDVFRWAKEGSLPHLKRMMDSGAYGYCRPAFPGHTPANFATLFTGAYPEVNGVNDGPMHAEGSPLSQISIPGFSSTAKKVEPLWITLEKSLGAHVTLLSIPGSTPPELKHGNTIRGRWGRWGADFHAVNFQDDADPTYAQYDRNAARLFFQGAPLTQRVNKSPTTGWPSVVSFSPKQEAVCVAWGKQVRACVFDSTDDQTVNFDRVALSEDGARILCVLKPGEWSDWLPITLKWRIPSGNLERDVPTQIRIKLVRLEANGLFRLRFFYNNLNPFMTEPPELADELTRGVGPMVDFVDNYPAQLIFYPEDKATFLEEARMSLDWHRDAASFVLKQYRPQIFIQSVYTPNQMLCSRWWMGYVDPKSARYRDVTDAERDRLWGEVKQMYRGIDDILGRMLDQAASETNSYVVLSSDHGALPLDFQVRLNNLFARKGWLQFTADPVTQERSVAWSQSRVVYLKMHSVFIHPDGLGGNWKRASGPAYEKLRSEVKQTLLELQDDQGVHPLDKVTEWENARKEFRLDPERTGDLVIANRPGFGWSEEMSPGLEVFSRPLVSGYKQAIRPEQEQGMWTPFVIIGPKVRKSHYLGAQPIEAVDQQPTVFRCLGLPQAKWGQGRVVQEVFPP